MIFLFILLCLVALMFAALSMTSAVVVYQELRTEWRDWREAHNGRG